MSSSSSASLLAQSQDDTTLSIDTSDGIKTPTASSSRSLHSGYGPTTVINDTHPSYSPVLPPPAHLSEPAVSDANLSSATISRLPDEQLQFQTRSTTRPLDSQSLPATSLSTSPARRAGETISQSLAAASIGDSPTSFGGGFGTKTILIGGYSSLRLQTDVQASSQAVSVPSTMASPPRHLSETASFNTSTSPGTTAAPTSSCTRPSSLALQHKGSSASLNPALRTPNPKTSSHYGFGSASTASSTVSSPIISAMGDVTPLPSPLLSSDSPGPWKKLGRSPPSDMPPNMPLSTPVSALVTTNGESLAAALAHQTKRKAYAELAGNHTQPIAGIHQTQPDLHPTHARNRSLSEYVPDPMQLPRRMITVSATHPKAIGGPEHVEASYEPHMRREPHLSETRGLTPAEKPPTPPPSESSLPLSDVAVSSDQSRSDSRGRPEYFEAIDRDNFKRRRWRSVKLIGQGTFSRVMLATSQISLSDDVADNRQHPTFCGTTSQPRYDRRTLVAVKVCEHGPKGGASEDRIEMSLKRELEIMQCINHPSLVRLKAWNIEPTRAILVLSYCPGGDLFDVASAHRDLLKPQLLARVFSELVGAVRYLHSKHIVHRDIKLENVLVNLTPKELADPSTNWVTYPHSVATLTDLGLSRRVADNEKLETRCGSDDYAAPEVIMGQPYDGRATDAWSLGVLLYALLEGRLPFDPHPGMSDAHRLRSRTSHRIARVEWRWVKFAGDEGDHEGDTNKFRAMGLQGAMEITEGLLRRARARWTLEKVQEMAWVCNALLVPGGLRFREEEEGEEIL